MIEKVKYILNNNSEEIRAILKDKYGLNCCACCEFDNAVFLSFSWYVSDEIHGLGYNDDTMPLTKEEIVYRVIAESNREIVITNDVDSFARYCLKALKWKETRKKIIRDWSEEKEPFTQNEDGTYTMPLIPVLDKSDMKEYIFPKLIELGAIPKEKLKIGKTYFGDCRNAHEATWNGKHFSYIRHKFGASFIEEIEHFQDDNCDGYDVFVPIKEKE